MRNKKPKLPGDDILMAAIGRRLGYPECCILEFIESMVAYLQNKEPKREERKLCGTGYVPCAKCNAEKTEAELIAAIASRRDPKLLAFPDDSGVRFTRPRRKRQKQEAS